MNVLLNTLIDSHNVNYSEMTQDLLEDEDSRGLQRKNTELILNQTENMLETIPEVTSSEDKIEIQAHHFAAHSKNKHEEGKDNISGLREPMIRRRVYSTPSF